MRPTWLIPVLAGLAPALVAQGKDDRPERSVKDPELQGRINRAIFQGIEYLKEAQQADGSWTYDRRREGGRVRDRGDDWPGANDATGGLTALGLYALAASGVPATDRAIERGLLWCERNGRPFSSDGTKGTYSASLLILALTRIDAVKHERWIRRLAARIVAAQLRNAQWTYFLFDRKATAAGRGSRRGPRAAEWLRQRMLRGGDNSNTQFAILALWAAQAMAGFKVPRKTWQKIATFFKHSQQKNGEWTYRDPAETTAGDRRGRGGGMRTRLLRPTLTMTAAGLCSYVYAWAALHGGIRGLPRARRTKVADKGLRAFIAERPRWSFANYYLIYSIERVGTVLGVPEVAWYVQGARKLVRKQRKDGHWEPPGAGFRGRGDEKFVYETALALLFLSKATAYPITPRGPRRQ